MTKPIMAQEQKALASLELALPFGVFTMVREILAPALERARVVAVLDAAGAHVARECGMWRLHTPTKVIWFGDHNATIDEARSAAADAIEKGEA